MAYSILTREKNNLLYTIACRNLPLFELGTYVPNFSYYIQYIPSNQHDIFDTSIQPPKKIKFGDVMELGEDKISAILQTIVLLNELSVELSNNK